MVNVISNSPSSLFYPYRRIEGVGNLLDHQDFPVELIKNNSIVINE
jgi:hypothetical protein